jgi:hypothetical protein
MFTADRYSTQVAAFRRAEIPHPVHILMLDQGLGQVIAVAGDNVHHAGRHIRGIQYLVKVGGAQRVGGAGDDDHRVAAAIAGATSETNASSGFSSGQAIPTTPTGSFTPSVIPSQRGLLDRPAVFIRPGGIHEEALHGGLHFRRADFSDCAGHCPPAGKLLAARIQVLGGNEYRICERL